MYRYRYRFNISLKYSASVSIFSLFEVSRIDIDLLKNWVSHPSLAVGDGVQPHPLGNFFEQNLGKIWAKFGKFEQNFDKFGQKWLRHGQIGLDLGKFKILHPQKH